MGKHVPLWELCYLLGKKKKIYIYIYIWNSVGCTKSKDRILLADLVCFEVQCLPRSAQLKIFLILAFWWWRFKSACPFFTFLFIFLHQLLLVWFLLCFLLLLLLWLFFLPFTKTIFCRKRLCFLVSLCYIVSENISFVKLTSSSLIPQKKNVFFYIHEITQVAVLYISLRFVEGVYKPQWACVGWAGVTESCPEACMGIKRTCFDEFPQATLKCSKER